MLVAYTLSSKGTNVLNDPQKFLYNVFEVRLGACGAAGARGGGGRALRLGWARGPSAAARTHWGQALRLGKTWEVSACEIAHLIS